MPPLRKRTFLPTREAISYPKIKVTPDNDACRNKSFQHEHVLECGHLVTTPTANEPCAPNCHHVSNSTKPRNDASKDLEISKFYCDACADSLNETATGHYASSPSADKPLLSVKRQEVLSQDKTTTPGRFRKCYIAQKITSVPCDEEGDVVVTYIPHGDGHPFDTALPRTGANMFKDVEVPHPKRTNAKRKVQSNKGMPVTPVSDTSDYESERLEDADQGFREDVEDTIAEGARWLREQEDLDRRRQEGSLVRVRKIRTATRPIVYSSSPHTRTSTTVVKSSSPTSVPTSSQNSVRTPTKRKRPSQEAAGVVVGLQAAKRARATPKSPSKRRGEQSKGVSRPSLNPKIKVSQKLVSNPKTPRKATNKMVFRATVASPAAPAAPQSARKPSKRSSK